MSDVGMKAEYALGRSPHEHKRLATQGALAARMTRHVFEAAGIAAGMKVLDVGCGAGDVALLAGEMVGPTGEVIGIDVDENVLAKARDRAQAGGMSHVRFEHGDFHHFGGAGTFDAVVGRLVLLYQKDPAEALRAAAQAVKPGGIVAFQEGWFLPPPPGDVLFAKVGYWVVETLRRSGAHANVGYDLYRIYQAAGLPGPQMSFEMVADGDPDSPIADYAVDTLRSLLPKAIEYGITTAEEVGIDTLAQRVRDDARARKITYMVMPLFGAWCRK
jgi:ubiquinone/menaquinone biosynthesis C-methylase UbiE